jgi:GNAT superfamily N-acetyltransferase
MQHWAVEYGTLWALKTAASLPPIHTATEAVEFLELTADDIAGLTSTMNLSEASLIQQRLPGNGVARRRRCFGLRVNGEIATYGWVTLGVELVGELERKFHLNSSEAYVWDCVTTPTWRKKGFYTVLLGHIIYQLHSEGVPLIWIGSSRQNQPSIRGMANAGFKQVVDVTYLRVFRLTLMWWHRTSASGRPLVSEAYRIMLNSHERRLGRLAIGYLR